MYVTGSNSKFLSSDILTEFRGRGDQIHIYPILFYEYFNSINLDFDAAFNEYLTFGGMLF
ncbi:AAA family ATPase [Mycoplasmopsis lipophila]|uniref:AAA family ATPase n=1 Tax=Mycoplasmopsis lipophila TaxID=2117 RepID=UPI003873C114